MVTKEKFWYLFCFMLGALTYFIVPKDYHAPTGTQAIAPTKIIDKATVDGYTCLTYTSTQKTNSNCYKSTQ